MRTLLPFSLVLAAACGHTAPSKLPWTPASDSAERTVGSTAPAPHRASAPPPMRPQRRRSRDVASASKEQCAPLRRRVSIRVSRADLVSVLTFIAEEAGLNLVIDSDVRGVVTTDLRNVSVQAALDALMKTYDLDAVIEGCVLSARTR